MFYYLFLSFVCLLFLFICLLNFKVFFFICLNSFIFKVFHLFIYLFVNKIKTNKKTRSMI